MKARFEKMRSEQSGFTLVELLIVIVILGILATVVTFGVVNFRASANTAACDANAATVTSAAQAYNAQNQAFPGSIAALVSAQYLSETPATTYGGSTLTYTAGTGIASC